MDSDQKRYFCSLCAAGSVTQAAKDLYLSRQGLSKSMRSLEEQLGVALFVRGKTGVELTEAGRILRRYIQEEDRLWSACMTEIRAAGDASPELVRVGMLSMYYGYEQKRSLFTIFKDNPNVRVEVVDGDHDANWQAIIEGRMELAFTMCPPDSLHLPSIKLGVDKMAILLGVKNPLAQLAVVDFEVDLPGQTVLQTSPYKDKLFDPVFRSYGVRSELIHFDKNLMLARVATGDDCFIIQERYASMLVTEQVCMRQLVNTPLVMNTFLVYRPGLESMAREVARAVNASFQREESEPQAQGE